jgi:hypothetical protein
MRRLHIGTYECGRDLDGDILSLAVPAEKILYLLNRMREINGSGAEKGRAIAAPD